MANDQAPMTHEEPASRGHWDLVMVHSPSRIHLAWLIVPCLAADGLMVPVLSGLNGGPPSDILAPFALGIAGCVLAQGCLLAAWVIRIWSLVILWAMPPLAAKLSGSEGIYRGSIGISYTVMTFKDIKISKRRIHRLRRRKVDR